ncbi:helix-turn-helix domain-containing protein [Aquimarina muelleri]|uniref:helix-turn-helix domain-containing protein n=1 Tax=Aquimarina muelleri TaxID=279356 RepID=UPI0003FFACE4|nr:helix-turn-helix domain-containing protein [Aquimarina muelleri]MCX2761272.1 helix-turn-helix domain-containing protein [Aquimarina muelleri]
MRLIHKIIITFSFGIFLLFTSSNSYSFENGVGKKKQDIASLMFLFSENNFYTIKKSDKTNSIENLRIAENNKDSIAVYKELAFSYATSAQPSLACEFIEKYVKASLDMAFITHSHFYQIAHSKPYRELTNKYVKKIDWWGIFCFYVAFVGIFVSIVLNLRKKTDKISGLLMGGFLFCHSLFMIHIGVYLMNYSYYYPHVYYMSTIFSLLYGPLIYFYFKRITSQYSLKKEDLLHLAPTFLLGALLFSVYTLTGEEKLRILLEGENPYLVLIMISKLISLLAYSIFLILIYVRNKKEQVKISKLMNNWQTRIIIFCLIYVVVYAMYVISIKQYVFSDYAFYLQISSTAFIVLYVSYSAFVRPSLFEKVKVIASKGIVKRNNSKYEKSGLTSSLSMELKSKLLYLLDEEKIYKQNDITLQKLSESLNTTRHNASQIVNEHFGLNFFELINKYRIEEAKELLKNKKYKDYAIIDIAYEVGFNNKVTFNKSFKKYNQITPSEYMKLFVL